MTFFSSAMSGPPYSFVLCVPLGLSFPESCHISRDFVCHVSDLGKLVSHSTGIHRRDVLRRAFKAKHVFCDIVAAAQHIRRVRSKCVSFRLYFPRCQGEHGCSSLRKSTEDVTGIQSRSYKDFLVLRTVGSIDTFRHLLADLDRTGSVVNECFISILSSRLIPAFFSRLRIGWCNIEHLLEL